MSSVLGGHADDDNGDRGLGERRGVISIKAPKTQKGGKTVNFISLGRTGNAIGIPEERTEPKLEKKHGQCFRFSFSVGDSPSVYWRFICTIRRREGFVRSE